MNTPQTKTEFEDELDWFAAIVENEQQRKELLATTDDDAQGWLDLLQLLAEYPDVETTLRSNIFEIMIRLSRRTGRHPRCLTIQNVEMLGAHPVGGGAFGDVWKGKIRESLVCVKVLRVFTKSEVEQILKDYMQEAIVWRQLNHRNLLPFMGIYYLDSNLTRLCLISPWMERGNLVQFMKNFPELVDRDRLAHDVACGLSHLHDMKIVHSDIKGVNILITPDLGACIGDFGLARISDTQRLLSSQTNISHGTMRWLSPELLRPGLDCIASRASDVYAYGCVCYEIYTGRIPFYELTDGAVIFAVVADKQHPTRPRDLPILTNAVWDIMVGCWNVEPSSRPTMVDILASVRRLLSDDSAPSDSERASSWSDPKTTQIWNNVESLAPVSSSRARDGSTDSLAPSLDVRELLASPNTRASVTNRTRKIRKNPMGISSPGKTDSHDHGQVVPVPPTPTEPTSQDEDSASLLKDLDWEELGEELTIFPVPSTTPLGPARGFTSMLQPMYSAVRSFWKGGNNRNEVIQVER